MSVACTVVDSCLEQQTRNRADVLSTRSRRGAFNGAERSSVNEESGISPIRHAAELLRRNPALLGGEDRQDLLGDAGGVLGAFARCSFHVVHRRDLVEIELVLTEGLDRVL